MIIVITINYLFIHYFVIYLHSFQLFSVDPHNITAVFTYHTTIYHWYDFHSKACKRNTLNILVT